MLPLSEPIDLIRGWHRKRCFAMDQRKRLDLALGAFLRLMMDWRKDLPEAERKAIAIAAARMMDNGDGPWSEVIAASRKGTIPFEKIEDDAKKEMARLAKQLPVWGSFGADVRGFGEVSLAVIVAEAGDLSNYASESKLWKRMGLAPGQNRVPPNLSKEQRAQAWIDRGYSPRRRSHMWNIGDTLIKAQVRIVKDADGKDTGERVAIGKYGDVYLQRKLHTQKTHPEWWRDKDGDPKLDEKTGRAISDHGNKDAQRYMEKRLLRDLWKAWRRANSSMSETTNLRLPAAENSNREAKFAMPKKAIDILPPPASAPLPLPKGHAWSADVTNSNGKALELVPAKARRALPPSTSAGIRLPKGHNARADVANSLAGVSLPKGQSRHASEAPAIIALPKGQTSHAGAKNSLAVEAMPKGQESDASEVSANRRTAKAQRRNADTKNSDAPQGAGEANLRLPAKAGVAVPPRQQ